MSWGSLGDIVFLPLAGPLDEGWKAAVEIAEHPRIGRKPTQQLAGLKLEELSLRVCLDVSLGCSPEEDVATWRTAMEAGEALPLVMGATGDSGCYASDWLLASLDVTSVERAPGGGRIRHLELAVALKEYVAPDDLPVSKRKARPAVRKKGKVSPAVASGSGYKEDA